MILPPIITDEDISATEAEIEAASQAAKAPEVHAVRIVPASDAPYGERETSGVTDDRFRDLAREIEQFHADRVGDMASDAVADVPSQDSVVPVVPELRPAPEFQGLHVDDTRGRIPWIIGLMVAVAGYAIGSIVGDADRVAWLLAPAAVWLALLPDYGFRMDRQGTLRALAIVQVVLALPILASPNAATVLEILAAITLVSILPAGTILLEWLRDRDREGLGLL